MPEVLRTLVQVSAKDRRYRAYRTYRTYRAYHIVCKIQGRHESVQNVERNVQWTHSVREEALVESAQQREHPDGNQGHQQLGRAAADDE